MEKVTIVITTYNLEKYIEQALLSVCTQKTDFEFKVRVIDDASQDKTSEIIKKIQRQYPDKVELHINSINRGSLASSNKGLESLRSEYFSFLDGDDFWLTDTQLQKQVDFLEEHKEYTLCGGNTWYLRDGKYGEKVVEEGMTNKSYGFCDYVDGNIPFIHTSSIVLRNVVYNHGLPEIYNSVLGTYEECACRGECFRFLQHLEKGKVFVFPDMFSCYRIHSNGIWQGASQCKRLIETAITENFYSKYYSKYEKEISSYFEHRFEQSYRSLMRYLFLDRNIQQEYMLNSKETQLLCGLLQNVSDRKEHWNISQCRGIRKKIKNKLRRALYR